MNPQYKIHGQDRRTLKKELSEIKSFLKNYWWYDQLDRDMASFYGGSEGFPMSKDKAQEIYDKNQKEVDRIEGLLSVPY